MYQPTLARFMSRDPLPDNGVELLYPFPDMTTYDYTRNNPVNRIDPSGLACEPAKPPKKLIPPEDPYHPVSAWRPMPPGGYILNFDGSNRRRFKGVCCCDYAPEKLPSEVLCCTMDLEILARAYRYWRDVNGSLVNYTGDPMLGLSNDPRNFFSIVVVTVCRTNVVCPCNKKMPDVVDSVVSRPLQKDGLGVYIRQHDGDIEQVSARFSSDDACYYAQDLVAWIERNTRASPPL